MLIVLTAAFGYVNVRLLKLPPTIGLMVLTLVFSIGSCRRRPVRAGRRAAGPAVVEQFGFDQALLHGMLGFLLFAGALHIDLSDLSDHKWPIAVLATLGVLISTAIVGGLTWVMLQLLGLPLRSIDCLLFGALISPTDPIAVLSPAQADWRTEDAGDPDRRRIALQRRRRRGVFRACWKSPRASGRSTPAPSPCSSSARPLGGALFGLVAGLLAYRLIKSVDHYRLEILLSLALVAGGYAAAEALDLSGPIAMVVAGLLIGNHGRSFAMSPTTIEHLDRFWGLLDDFLNAALFVMIGIEVLLLTFTTGYLVAGLLAVAIVLLARLVSVGVPVWLLRRWERFEPSMIPILTWGGLRGGISVALALSLPSPRARTAAAGSELILAMTYVVVVFSILVQGLTVGWLIRSLRSEGRDRPGVASDRRSD